MGFSAWINSWSAEHSLEENLAAFKPLTKRFSGRRKRVMLDLATEDRCSRSSTAGVSFHRE
jgi:hypothetical protein